MFEISDNVKSCFRIEKRKTIGKNDRLIHQKFVYSNVKKIDSKGFKRKKKIY